MKPYSSNKVLLKNVSVFETLSNIYNILIKKGYKIKQ